MENQFYIHVKPEEMHRYESGTVIGLICCQYDTKFFPDEIWDDFVIIILNWWIQAAYRLLKNQSKDEELLFMDGPFEMTLEMGDDGKCEMTWIDEPENETFSFTLDFDRFLEQLIGASQAVIQKCKTENWDSTDLQSLIHNQQALVKAKG